MTLSQDIQQENARQQGNGSLESTASESQTKENPVSKRLLSIDVFRGAIMFFIMGGSTLIVALAKLFPGDFSTALITQMQHAEWHGFTFEDMIFPSFLFLAGVSFPFSLAKQRASGKSEWQIYRKLFVRMIILVLLGVAYNNRISFDFAHLRYASVLGHIGIAWFFAAVLFMNTRFRTLLAFSIFILVGYWLLVALVPAPDNNPQECFTCQSFTERASHLLSPDDQIKKNYTPEGSIVCYVDRQYLPGKVYRKIYDPEGILSIFPAIVTAILGTMAGSLLRKESWNTSPQKKVLVLFLCGVLLIVIGQFWNLVFPFNKKLWTSSFTCYVGGLSMVLLSLFYYIVDVLKLRKWSFFFAVIGVNSITIYLAQTIIGFNMAKDFFFNGFSLLFPAEYRPVILGAGYIIVCWCFLLFLYRRKIFLKI